MRNKLSTAPGLWPSLFFMCCCPEWGWQVPQHLSTQPRGHLGHSRGPNVPTQGLDEMGPHCIWVLGHIQKGPKDLEFWGQMWSPQGSTQEMRGPQLGTSQIFVVTHTLLGGILDPGDMGLHSYGLSPCPQVQSASDGPGGLVGRLRVS